LGSLILSEQGLSKPDSSAISKALIQGIRQAGLDKLSWTTELRQWRARIAFLCRIEGQDSRWPDLSDDTLRHTLDDWLGPFLSGITTLDRATKLDLTQPLHALLSWEQSRHLERLAPTHLTVPSGSSVRVEYETLDLPILAVRLQEMFGCKDTPRLVDGKIPVMLHLLSPARRPVQITKDLASFWATAYQEVRKELRGRYLKHSWPENPLAAQPTAKTKRQGQ
jgi:ATP-dependent helicase HrpB